VVIAVKVIFWTDILNNVMDGVELDDAKLRYMEIGGGPQKLDNVLSSKSAKNRKELT